MDCSPPGSSVHGIFQAKVLEWVATVCKLYLKGVKRLQANIKFQLIMLMLKYVKQSVLISSIYFEMHFKKMG